MHAVIKTGGKQYRVKQGDIIRIEKLPVMPDEIYTFEEVLLLDEGADVTIGTPQVANASVKARVLKQGLGTKITIYKHKRRKGYRRKIGHRQPYSQVKIEEIVNGKPAAKAAPAVEAKPAPKAAPAVEAKPAPKAAPTPPPAPATEAKAVAPKAAPTPPPAPAPKAPEKAKEKPESED